MFSHLHLTMNSTGTKQGFGCTLSHSICWNSFNPSALTYPRSYMSNNHTIPSKHIMCGHLFWHSKHPLGSHIWNTCQWEHYSYRDLNLSHFVWTMYRCSCPFQVLVDYNRYWLLKQKWPIKNHSFLLHLVKELHCLLTSPALYMRSKPGIPQRTVQFYSPWPHCNQLCIHPWRFRLTIQLFPLLVFEI
jgi:hypothetical protein